MSHWLKHFHHQKEDENSRSDALQIVRPSSSPVTLCPSSASADVSSGAGEVTGCVHEEAGGCIVTGNTAIGEG